MKTGNSFVVELTVNDDPFTKTAGNGQIALTRVSSADNVTIVTV